MRVDITDYNCKIKPFAFGVLCASFVVFSAFSGATDSKPLSFALLLCALLMIFGFIRSTVCALLLTVPPFIIGLYTERLGIALLMCAIPLAVGIGAFLIRILGKRSPLLLLLLPLSYAVAAVCGRSWISAMTVIICFPASYVCEYCTRSKRTRLTSICAISVSLGICAAVFLAVYVLNNYTGDSPFTDASEKLFDFLLKYYTDEHMKLAEKYTQAGIDPSLLGLTAYDARLYAISVFGIVPSLALTLLNGIAFIAHRVNITLLDHAEIMEIGDLINIVFRMSPLSAILYITSYLVMTFASYSGSETSSMTGLIAQNVYIVLLPGLTLTGILFLIGRIAKKRRYIIGAVAIALLAFSSLNLALAVTAFIGSSFILIVFFKHTVSLHKDD